MKQLTLIRHAKSSLRLPGQSDFERPLNQRGRADLLSLVEGLKKALPKPDRIIYSGARRTLETSQPLAEIWQLNTARYLERRQAYEASLNTLLLLLQEQPDDCEHLILVGHNPGMAELLAFLTGMPLSDYPTAAWAHLELKINHWPDLQQACGDLKQFDYPGLHRDTQD